MLTKSETRPMITVPMLSKMLNTLSESQLAELPPENLPERIPADLYRRISEQKAIILQDLMMQKETFSMRQQVDDMEKFGRDVADALQQAESGMPPAGFNVLKMNVQNLASLSEQWNADFRGSLEDLSGKCGEIQGLLLELLTDKNPMVRAESVLVSRAKGKHAALDGRRLTHAIGKLRKKLAPVEDAMTQFNSLRLSVTLQEMSNLRKRLKQESLNQIQYQSQIDAFRSELDQKQSLWKRALSRYRTSEEYATIQNQISSLVAKKQMSEVIIDDEDLRRWLDALIEASMDETTRKTQKSGLHAARVMVFSLLDLYCRQQEESAMQIARNPFVQIDAKKAVEFMLASERFILEYFSRKEQDTAIWYRTTAENRREQLDDLRQDIIRELKRNMKKLKLH